MGSVGVLAGCVLSSLVWLRALAGETCGVPSAKYPPALRMRGDRVVGLQQGIVGGKEAQPHSYPWQILALRELKMYAGESASCGGAIIDRRWIATAAHCVFDEYGDKADPSSFTVYVGGHKFGEGKPMKVAKLIAHKRYDAPTHKHDIALIKMMDDIEFNDEVRPICLPEKTDSWRDDGTNVVVSGFGLTQEMGRVSSTLQHVVVPTAITECRRAFADELYKGNMCAVGKGKDACQGDSGGPLVGRKAGRFVLAGLVSWGIGCARSTTLPGVYVHVPHYVDWIQATMAAD